MSDLLKCNKERFCYACFMRSRKVQDKAADDAVRLSLLQRAGEKLDYVQHRADVGKYYHCTYESLFEYVYTFRR